MLVLPSDPHTHWSSEVPSLGRKRTQKWDRGFNRVFHFSVRKNWLQKRPRFWDHDLLRCVNFFGPAVQAAARGALTERVGVSCRGGDETSSNQSTFTGVCLGSRLHLADILFLRQCPKPRQGIPSKCTRAKHPTRQCEFSQHSRYTCRRHLSPPPAPLARPPCEAPRANASRHAKEREVKFFPVVFEMC